LGCDAASATTSYPALLAKTAEEELHIKPDHLGLKLALLGGEIGMGIPSFRKSVEQTWGMKAFDANFGLADVLSNFGAECSYRDGLHFLGQGGVILELVNVNSGDMIEPNDGEEGEIVLTNLDKEAQPLVRYRTGDVIKIITTDRCSCGRTGFRFKVMGRAHDVLKVKGINIYVSAIQDLVASFAPKTNGEFQIVLETPPPILKLTIRFEVTSSMTRNSDSIAGQIQKTVKESLGIEADFEPVPENSLPRFEGKTQRVVRTYEESREN
jgi:phenylacetate-CoA ligase